jgi:rod shape-determining protein MreC
METVLGRYRNLTILVGVLFLQVLGLAMQVKRGGNAEHTRLIRIWAVEAISPFERVLVWGQNGSSNLWHNYFFLRGVRAENRDLKDQIEKMRLNEVRLSEDAAQAHRLQSLLAFKEQFIDKTVAAQVIGSGGSDLSRIIYIDKGKNDGMKPDLAVITAGGIVGKVLQVFPTSSQVLMINDQSSGVGAMLEKSRLQGVVRGTPNGELILERVMSDEQVAAGETVLSSGGDQIFPKGLPLGTVSKVSPGREMFLNIHVKPSADLSRVEEVLVVTEKQEREPVAESGGRARAADILAQRLPSVPEKPAVAAGATPAGASTGTTVQPTGAGTEAKPQPNTAVKPSTGTAPTTTTTTTTTTTKPGEVLKKVAPKPHADDSATTSVQGSVVGSNAAGSNAAGSNAALTPVSAGPKAAPKPANTAAKPATVPPKASSTPPNPQPPAIPASTEDNPH